MSALSDLVSSQFLNSTPAAAFYRRFGGAAGLGSMNQNLSAFLRGKQDDTYNSYLGQLPDNPEMLYTSYLDNQDLVKRFRAQAPGQRGERQSQFSPTVRRIG